MLAALILQQYRLIGAHEKYLLTVIDVDKRSWSHATHGHISSEHLIMFFKPQKNLQPSKSHDRVRLEDENPR